MAKEKTMSKSFDRRAANTEEGKMAVILHEADNTYTHRETCSACGYKLRFPFLLWQDGRIDVCICGPCCQKIRAADFTADLIQIDATMKLQELGYRDHTLVRQKREGQEVRTCSSGCV
jgi:hypothetical protein